MSNCSRLITVSKVVAAVGGGSDIECAPDSPCECDDARLFTVVQRVLMDVSSGWCDELTAEIPDGSQFEARITHHLRLPSPCDAWIGYHAGTFSITGSDTQIVDGQMRATHGFDIHLDNANACCAYMHSEGIMLARTQSENPRLDGCRLMANYRTTQEIGSASDPCYPLSWTYWGLTMSGLLICSCV